MAVPAPPPHLSAAVGGDSLRRQRAVSLPVPLLSDLREPGSKVVFPGDDHPPGAHRAALAVGPGGDNGLPFVTLAAPPPDFFVASRPHVPRGKTVVFAGMPLGGQVGAEGGQVIFTGDHDLPGADGAAGPQQGTGLDLRLPLVASLASPPDLFVAARGDQIWGKTAVFGRMPLPQQQRVRDRYGPHPSAKSGYHGLVIPW